MGACYEVNLKIRFKEGGKGKAIAAMQEYIQSSKNVRWDLEKFAEEGATKDSLEGLLKIFLCGTKYWHPVITYGKKWIRYSNGFDGSYGWETVMMDMFEVMSPFLVDKSEMYIYPDNDYDHLVVRDGKYVQVH